jgi:hypothetical protein
VTEAIAAFKTKMIISQTNRASNSPDLPQMKSKRKNEQTRLSTVLNGPSKP